MNIQQKLLTSAAAVGLLVISSSSWAQDGGTPIPQPKVEGLKIADASKRVDLVLPKFSNPTQITNPLFPVSKQASVLFTGHVEDKPFRTEVTLLPQTRVVNWEGIAVETRVSQYVAYRDGRLEEVAFDLYAQADDGSVWYFGEDVSDFRDGVIFTKEGTWIAGKDGPPNMIMPGKPKVGDAYRAENMPGIAFEEVEVTDINHTYDGPLGAIPGALVGRELHADGTYDEKTFAPGYGEVFTGSDGNVEAVALAIPTDALEGPVPVELTSLTEAALNTFEAASGKDWKQATSDVSIMTAAWKQISDGNIPKPIKPLLTDALKSLADGVAAKNVARSRQAAIETARWAFDLQLRHRPVAEIDLARFDLMAAQVLVDAAKKDEAGVNFDMFTLMLIRDRILGSLDPETTQNLNIQLGELMPAAADAEFDAATEAAEKLRDIVAEFRAKK